MICLSGLELYSRWVPLPGTAVGIACSRRSDSGERCEVKRSAKKIKESPPLLFIAIFTSHRSPLSERLEQATVGTAANILSCVCRLTYLLSLLFLFVSISYFISLDPHGKEYQPILKYKELSMSRRVTRNQDWNTRVDSR